MQGPLPRAHSAGERLSIMPVISPEWIAVESQGDVTVLHVNGSSSTRNVGHGHVDIEDLSRIADAGSPHVLLNFDGIKSVRGPELTPFMRLAVRVLERQGRIAACHLPEGAQELLKIARLDRIVAVFSDQEQAIREMLLPTTNCD